MDTWMQIASAMIFPQTQLKKGMSKPAQSEVQDCTLDDCVL